LRPIGAIETCFPEKFGTPRQGGLTPSSWARLKLDASVCPPGIWEGLEGFSHVWVISWFHLNKNTRQQGKITPPRLRGGRVGVFASRSPHRPNPIGLTLAKIESVKPYEIEMSGLDLVSGTPILDIKPYVPAVDAIQATIPDWLVSAERPAPKVVYTPEAEEQLAGLKLPMPKPRFLKLIEEVLAADPRPIQFARWKVFAVMLFNIDIKFRPKDDAFEIFLIERTTKKTLPAIRTARSKTPSADRKRPSSRPS
jgi:tRNA (adenine37-N6)-methyltransferase